MDLEKAIKIINIEEPFTKEEYLKAHRIFFEKICNVDIKNSDGSFKNIYTIFKEASQNYKK